MPIISDGNNRTGDELSDKHVTVGTVEHTGSYVVSGTAGNQLLVNTASMSVQYAVAPGGYATSVSPNIGVFENANGSQPTISVYRADDTKAYGGSFGLARSSTTGSVGSGDSLGSLSAAGNDGTRMNMAAEVAFAVDGAVSTDQMPGRIEFRVNPGDGSTVMPGRAMVIKSDGKVGIGTGTPSDDLHVVGTSKLQGNTEITGSLEVLGKTSIQDTRSISENYISFDGVDDRIMVGDYDVFTFSDSSGDTPFSVSAWIYVNDVSTDIGTIVGKFTLSGTGNEWMFKQEQGYLHFYMYDFDKSGTGDQKRIIASSATVTSNTWHHVVITCDGGDGGVSDTGYTLYTDGSTTAGTAVFTNSYEQTRNTGAPLTIGAADLGSGNRIFEDRIADIVIFNKELTSSEVTELYNGGVVKNVREHSAYKNVISWWKMGDDLDSDVTNGIKDYVGGYHGTLQNGAAIVSETSLVGDVIGPVTITSSGSLGIGTSNPEFPLHVFGNSKLEGNLEIESGTTTVKSSTKFKTKSISFDGTDDYISISDHDDFTFNDGSSDTAFSIQAWIKIADTATDEGSIVSKYNANTAAEWLFWQDNGVLRVNLYDSSQATPTVNSIKLTGNSADITNNNWHHVVITYDGSESHTGLTGYVDGAAISATTELSNTYTGMINTTVPVQIGGTYSGTIDFEKRIGSVAIFTKELTSTEVLELYNGGKVMNLENHSAYSDILSWWKMGDDQDTTGTNGIKDYVGSHHGTLNGDASIVDEHYLPSEYLETFRVNTSGNVGIGTTTPEKKLHVYGDTKLQGDLHITGSLEIDGSVTRDLIVSSSQIKVTSAGSTSLFLEADTDNATETDTAYIKLSQDGGIVNSHIGFAPADGKNPENSNYTNAKSNALLISNNYPNTHLQLGTTTTVAITIDGSQNVGIGTNAPSHLLDVDGNANISGSLSFEDYMILSVTADNTDIQTGTSQFTFRTPFAMELYQTPRASLTTASSSGAVTIDINSGGTSIFSTSLTIDANETTSTTAATAAVLSTTSIADDTQITIDVDGAGTGARGLKITLYYRRTI